ncbi:MAG: hypothetical protein E7364_07145 [Clostridiales bacterium]|nr:hypothetical protein [Clostridiales bacterium]
MIDSKAFIEKYYPNANAQRENDVERFLSYVDALLKEDNPSTRLLDKEFLCRTFFLQSTNSISRQHYQKIKEYLLNLFDWFGVLGTVPTREEVMDSQQTSCYFRDLDSILNLIDEIGASLMAGYNPNADLATVKAIVVLGWHGLSPREIAVLKKNELISDDNTRYLLEHNGEMIAIEDSAYTALKALRYLDSYRGLPSGKVRVFKGDESFLFRPTTSCPRVEENHIILAISRFNSLIPKERNVAIIFRNLRKNALFVKIYQDKSNRTLLEKICSIMGCSENSAFNYREQYYKWVNSIYTNKI